MHAIQVLKRQKNQKYHEKRENIPAFRCRKHHYWHTSRAQCFFWSIFGSFRVIGRDTEHERIFLVVNLVYAAGE